MLHLLFMNLFYSRKFALFLYIFVLAYLFLQFSKHSNTKERLPFYRICININSLCIAIQRLDAKRCPWISISNLFFIFVNNFTENKMYFLWRQNFEIQNSVPNIAAKIKKCRRIWLKIVIRVFLVSLITNFLLAF